MDVYIFTVRVLKSIERVGYLPNILISPDGNNNNNNNISYNVAHFSRTRTGTVGIYTHANTVHLYIFITIMQVVFTRRPNDMIIYFFGRSSRRDLQSKAKRALASLQSCTYGYTDSERTGCAAAVVKGPYYYDPCTNNNNIIFTSFPG